MWLYRINASSLDEKTRIMILERLRDRPGYTRAYEALSISDSSLHLHRYLKSERKIPGDVVRKALQHLREEEFTRSCRTSIG
jgi:predicted kinase